MGALDWQIRPLQHDNPQTREGIPYGFDLLLSHGSISPNLFAIIAELNTLLREPASPDTTNTNTNTILVYCSTHLKHIIDSDTVSSIELQLCCGLHAFCALVRHQLTSTHDADLAQYFDKLTSRFIHHKLAGASASTLHRSTLQWASLMLGSACFLPLPDIPSSTHTKGHIILFTLHERLLPTTSFNEEATINNLCQELSETFWLPSSLASPLKQIYQAAMTRQRDWEGRGLFKMGVPNGDRVEYMVLRSFRGALPTIPMVDLWE